MPVDVDVYNPFPVAQERRTNPNVDRVAALLVRSLMIYVVRC